MHQTDPLKHEDLMRVAELHAACLPDSQVSKLGPRYARSYYRYIVRSPHEHLFLERVEDQIAGVCVLSLDPRALERRLLFGSALVPAILVRPQAVQWSSKLRRSRPATDHALPESLASLPEVLQIYTADIARGRGIGASLLNQTESLLRSRGISEYIIKTVDSEDNRALSFYEKNGFRYECRYMSSGRPFQVWSRSI